MILQQRVQLDLDQSDINAQCTSAQNIKLSRLVISLYYFRYSPY